MMKLSPEAARYTSSPSPTPPFGIVSLGSYFSVTDHVPRNVLKSFSISGLGCRVPVADTCDPCWSTLDGVGLGDVCLASCAIADNRLACNKSSKPGKHSFMQIFC